MSDTGIEITQLPSSSTLAADAVFPFTDPNDTSATPDGTTYKITATAMSSQLGVGTAQSTAEAAAAAAANAAAVYVHDGSEYVLTGGRIFVGPEDPEDDGFALNDGDQWLETD